MAAKIRALQQWCKVQCDGYRDVSITNMTSSWKSGLAFCAIIHRFYPDLIDFESLSKENVFENNKLAFDTAASLGIDALLDPEDMVAMPVPDKLCIVTYVSQYYNHFSRCQPVGGPNVSRPVQMSTNNNARVGVKRPALESVTHNNVQDEDAGSRRNTWQDECCVCHKKVYLMERHMNSSRLYHRSCYRHQERRASSMLFGDIESADSAVDMPSAVMMSDDDRSASVGVSMPSVLKNSDTTSLSSTSRADCFSPPMPAFGLPSSGQTSSLVVTHEHAIPVKPSTENWQTVVNGTVVREPISQVDTALVDVSALSSSQQTDSAILHVSTEPSATPEELVNRCLPRSEGGSMDQLKSAVSDGSERLQSGVVSENFEKRKPHELVKTSLPSSASESSPSSPRSSPRMVSSRLAPVSPRSCRPSIDTSQTAQHLTSHSPSVDAPLATISPLINTPLPLPCMTVSAIDCYYVTTALAAVGTEQASESSESSCKTDRRLVDDHHCAVAPRRPAPLPPRPTQQKTVASNQPRTPTRLKLDSVGHTAVTVSTTPEMSFESSQNGRSSNEHSLQADVQANKQTSKEAVRTRYEEQTASASSQDQPVPIPRHHLLPKQEVPEINTALSVADKPPALMVKAVSDRVSLPVKPTPAPVPRPRKNVLSVIVESSDMVGEGKRDVAVRHEDVKMLQEDRPLATISEASGEPVKQLPIAHPRSPATSLEPGEGKKSPSLSPSLPVKYPRSKKRSAAPVPPRPSRPVVSELQSPKPESSSVTEAAGSQPLQVAAGGADKLPTVNSEHSNSTTSPQPVRRKITPGMKFTFENDMFQPAAVDTSAEMEHLKPSRPAPPRPRGSVVTKRMVSAEEPLPVDFIKQRLAVLDAELKRLEQDGCHMEDRIRSLSDADGEVMMSDWLDMVQKKNEFVREESELIYRLRQQELEDRHSQVEYELRRLMAVPERKKTEAQRSREGELLQQLLVTVHRRNNIVDSMEEDRKRYLAEDKQISQMKATQGIDRKKKAG